MAKKDEDSRAVEIKIGDKTRIFDIDDPKLPDWVDDKALESGGYPYDKKMDKDEYEETLEKLQVELVKVQFWLQETGHRIISVFEGRDAAGKGGSIHVTRAISIRARRVSWRSTSRPRPNAVNGTTSATSPTFRPPASS